MLVLILILTGIHLLAWNSKAFTEWYRLHVFPIWTELLGRVSNLFSGSVGEILIIIGIFLLVFELVLLPGFIWRFVKKRRSGSAAVMKHQRFWTKNVGFFCWVLIYIYATETLNCYILYHAPTVEEQYYSDAGEYGTQELLHAYTEVVTRANELSKRVKRDADGKAVYGGSDQALYEECKKAMRAQGMTYPYLAGYYPDPKPIRASDFMSQQHLLGIYFPFTMEANYNTVMYPVNLPTTICHEYSHLKGIILEDEANYFGFCACIESKEPYLQYSGYLSVLGYLSKQVQRSVPEDMRVDLVSADEQVIADDVFLTKEQWERVEEEAIFSTEMIDHATDVFLEKNLTMNGVEAGIQSYSQVVRLVIDYYENGSFS